ncbi:RNA polymerase Rpb4 family protein [Halonotius terrestris]|uniref:DNA-directed RNA polymerase subunit Rpo4 n=1 Tax=Halonotius terrestris TaxID=2487750 RepID=A0A8J8PA53_9EURY|nr:RNA polymerase Rpb4 family protein [Halonotius terrestris]TQQ82600.1 RNA polymerase Rpb4 family protein [Halonotius terrestris]
MTIFKEKIDEEYVTISEVKTLLNDVEAERAADEDRDLQYELARAIEHVNRHAVLEAEESRELVDQLLDLEKVNEKIAHRIADLLPQDRTELRAIYAKERHTLDGEELDEILNVVAQYT